MSDALPEYMDLTRVDTRPIRLTGELKLATLPRLIMTLADSGGSAVVVLRVVDAGRGVVAEGAVRADLVLTCQRCCGNLRLPVRAELDLAWVRT